MKECIIGIKYDFNSNDIFDIFEFKNLRKYILRDQNQTQVLKEQIITISKKRLSPYFVNVTLDTNLQRNEFQILIDENRFKFMKNIENHMNSHNLF